MLVGEYQSALKYRHACCVACADSYFYCEPSELMAVTLTGKCPSYKFRPTGFHSIPLEEEVSVHKKLYKLEVENDDKHPR